MAFWDKFVGNTLENAWKEGTGIINKGFEKPGDLAANLLTGGMYSMNKVALKTGGDTLKDFQYRNGGKTIETAQKKMKEEEDLAANKQARLEFDKSSTLAAAAYGSGGSNMQSFTNKSQNKKSILGSF